MVWCILYERFDDKYCSIQSLATLLYIKFKSMGTVDWYECVLQFISAYHQMWNNTYNQCQEQLKHGTLLLTNSKIWLSNYIHSFTWDIISHPFLNFGGGITKPLMKLALIAGFMRPTWGPSGADRTQVGPMLAPWILLSGRAWMHVAFIVWLIHAVLVFW